MKKLLYLLTILSLIGCQANVEETPVAQENADSLHRLKVIDSLDKEIISDYDMSGVDPDQSVEFRESLRDIEKQYGEQWSFCDCIVKGDSIDKAFKKEVSSAEFDRLSARFDEIDEKCKAFKLQNPNGTPEERAAHEKKVKECLKNANIK